MIKFYLKKASTSDKPLYLTCDNCSMKVCDSFVRYMLGIKERECLPERIVLSISGHDKIGEPGWKLAEYDDAGFIYVGDTAFLALEVHEKLIIAFKMRRGWIRVSTQEELTE